MLRHRAIHITIAFAFSLVVGQFAWRTLGPPVTPTYFVGGHGVALTGPNPDTRHLYLRRKFYLSERPRHSWIQAITRGRMRIYVNGTLLAERAPDGFMGAVLADPTPLLQIGPNVIAITIEQYSPKRPAMIALDGAYLLSDGSHAIPSDSSWRCSETFEQGMDWWFMPKFDDHQWAAATIVEGDFRAEIKAPPRASTQAPAGRWITAADWTQQSAFLRRQFEIDGRPQQAWLRLTTTGMYRVAVNGLVLDVHEDGLGVTKPPAPIARIYDITPYLQPGANAVAVALHTPAAPPRLQCDLECEDSTGRRHAIGTDGEWQGTSDPDADWLAIAPLAGAGWGACHVESGDVGVMPWDLAPSFAPVEMPFELWSKRAAVQWAATAMLFMITAVGCWIVGLLLSIGRREPGKRSAPGIATLSLVPATIALGVAWLATFDPRVDHQTIYRPEWLAAAGVSVGVQWVVLALLGLIGRRSVSTASAPPGALVAASSGSGSPAAPVHRPPRRRMSVWVGVAAAATVVAGFVVRLPGIDNRPLGADEVNMFRCVEGLYERGFPSFIVDENLPAQYVSTSEFVYVGGGLARLFFDSDRAVIRFPSVVWGTLTIVMIFVAGSRMFHPTVGLLGAAVYAFSPIPIAMADFGRYPSQLQFFALLTVFLFWCTVAGSGGLRRGCLLLTTLSTVAMFLSWEPSLLIAPGMIAAAVILRRGRLGTIVKDVWVWFAMGTVAVALLLQIAHRDLKQAQRMNYGTGASDVALMPMWRYAHFDVAHFLKAASWSQSDVLPMIGLAGALAIAARHPFRRPARFVLLILLVSSGIIALGLPVDADRYSYFLTPLLILAASGAAVGFARGLRKLIVPQAPVLWRLYGRTLARFAVLVLLILSLELDAATAEWDGTLESLNPLAESTRYLEGPAKFLLREMRPGDVVLGTQPYLLDHQMNMASSGTRQLHKESTLWLQSRLHLQAVLDDVRPLPLNRRDGTVMVPSLRALDAIFARPGRIWVAIEKGHFNRLNGDEIDAYLRQHMDVVFEDVEAVVLLRDERHRTAARRMHDEQTLRAAQTDYLRKDAAATPWGLSTNPGVPSALGSIRRGNDRDDVGPPNGGERP